MFDSSASSSATVVAFPSLSDLQAQIQQLKAQNATLEADLTKSREDLAIQTNRLEIAVDSSQSVIRQLDAAHKALYEERAKHYGDPKTKPPKPGEIDLGAWTAVDNLENVTWEKTCLIEGMVEQGRTYDIFGQWKGGKTLVLLDMLAHQANGMTWAGRRTIPALVLYVASEAPEDVKRRLAAWKRRHGICGPMPFLIREKPLHLDNTQFAKQLADEAAEIGKRYPDLPVIVAIDTVARSLSAGAEENGDGLRNFVNNVLDIVVRPANLTCFLVHHPGHGDKDRGRGWSGFPAAIDGEFKVSKGPGNPTIFTMENKFVRSGGNIGKMEFRLETVVLPGEDNFKNVIEEPVLRYLPGGESPSTEDELSDKAKTILAVFKILHDEHIQNLADGDIPSTPRVTKKDVREACQKLPKNFPKNFPKPPIFKSPKTFANWLSEGCTELAESGKLFFTQGYVLPGEKYE